MSLELKNNKLIITCAECGNETFIKSIDGPIMKNIGTDIVTIPSIPSYTCMKCGTIIFDPYAILPTGAESELLVHLFSAMFDDDVNLEGAGVVESWSKHEKRDLRQLRKILVRIVHMNPKE